MNKKGKKKFIEELINTFPKIKEEVLDEDWAGLTSLQIECFTEFTQYAIDHDEKNTVLKCFQFVADSLECVEFSIENSLVISWLGKLNFKKNNSYYDLLSPNLKEIYTKLENHYSNPSKNEKLNSFLKNMEKNTQ